MINYTERITILMRDIVDRVPTLNFIDLKRVLVFARFGRASADGPFATCHCLTLPPSEPGYYYWKDRQTGTLTRRSEYFVMKSPTVRCGPERIEYLISFTLPRFCNQTLRASRKREYYGDAPGWVAKLDTIVHELFHIDPGTQGIRRFERSDGSHSPRTHGPGFYETVAAMVETYLASGPPPDLYEFLTYDFEGLERRYGGVVGTTFRNFPSFPQRYREPLKTQPEDPRVAIERLKGRSQPASYTEDDLQIHQFQPQAARRLTRKGQHRAA